MPNARIYIMSQGVHIRKYGVEATIDFEVYGIDGVDLKTDWVPAAADCEIMKDGGASTQCTNTATDEGSTYSIVLTETEMQAARLVLKIVDAATKVFLDKVIKVETYGNASAMHPFDLGTAKVALSSTGLDDVLMSDLTSVPAATSSIKSAINWVFTICRNKVITNKTNLEIEVYKDDGTTKFAEADIADDGTTFTRSEFGSVD